MRLLNTRRTSAQVLINGKDITQDITPYLSAISFTDNLSGESDTAQLDLEDKERLWIADWFPKRGDTAQIKLLRQNWGLDDTLDLGTFEIDEISNSYPPHKCQIKLNSIANNTNLRSVNKSRSWEKVKLSKIALDIATESGLELFYDTAEDPTIDRAEQKEQSCLAFLTKLCVDNGLALKVNDKKIIIFDEEKYEAQEPVISFSYGDERIKSFSATATISQIYSACHVVYRHGKKSEKIEHTFSDNSKQTGMTLEVNKKVESKAEAEKLAKKSLREKNKDEVKVRLEVIGSFELLAGNTIRLEGHGFYSGKYIIEKADCHIGSGFTCSLELRKCLTGY